MKLGILVVYLVSNDNEKLLDIHLNQIKKCTISTFKIYGCVNLLSPQFKQILTDYNFINSYLLDPYKGPDDPQRGTKEQSYYLEQLIKIAHADGATNLAIMHPDSFPIKYGWDKYFDSLLNKGYTLVSNFPAMSACMFFKTDKYLHSNLSLLPNNNELKSPSWKNFQKVNETPHLIETGMGMAFQIYRKKQSWYQMKRTNRRQFHEYFAGIFDDRIFHLGSASEYKTRPMRNYSNRSLPQKVRKIIAEFLPKNFKIKIKNLIPEKILFPEIQQNQATFSIIRDKLLNDTNSFLTYLTKI